MKAQYQFPVPPWLIVLLIAVIFFVIYMNITAPTHTDNSTNTSGQAVQVNSTVPDSTRPTTSVVVDPDRTLPSNNPVLQNSTNVVS